MPRRPAILSFDDLDSEINKAIAEYDSWKEQNGLTAPDSQQVDSLRVEVVKHEVRQAIAPAVARTVLPSPSFL